MARLLVNIDVDRLEDAVRFYSAALGLQVGRRFGEGGVELVGAECPIYVLAAGEGSRPFPGAQVVRRYERHWTPIHLDFVVDDIVTAVRRAVAAGAVLEIPVQHHKYGKLAVLADPFGHGLCLLEFEGRGYDEITTGSGA